MARSGDAEFTEFVIGSHRRLVQLVPSRVTSCATAARCASIGYGRAAR
jgi:hypothetical protein